MTSPPLPPSPPSGPPFSTYFSRRKLIAPFPPCPEVTRIMTSSRMRSAESLMEMLLILSMLIRLFRNRDFRNSELRDRKHMNALHGLERLELYCSVDDCEQGIVAAHHDALAGFEMLATLTHDDVT